MISNHVHFIEAGFGGQKVHGLFRELAHVIRLQLGYVYFWFAQEIGGLLNKGELFEFIMHYFQFI